MVQDTFGTLIGETHNLGTLNLLPILRLSYGANGCRRLSFAL